MSWLPRSIRPVTLFIHIDLHWKKKNKLQAHQYSSEIDACVDDCRADSDLRFRISRNVTLCSYHIDSDFFPRELLSYLLHCTLEKCSNGSSGQLVVLCILKWDQLFYSFIFHLIGWAIRGLTVWRMKIAFKLPPMLWSRSTRLSPTFGSKGVSFSFMASGRDRFTTVDAEKSCRVHTLTFSCCTTDRMKDTEQKCPRRGAVFSYPYYLVRRASPPTPSNYPVVLLFEEGASSQLRVFWLESWHLLLALLALNLNAKVARQVRSSAYLLIY